MKRILYDLRKYSNISILIMRVIWNISQNFIETATKPDYHYYIGKVWNKFGNVRTNHKIFNASINFHLNTF